MVKWSDIITEKAQPSDDELLTAARRMSENDFIRHFIKQQLEPKSAYTAYDANGKPVATFGNPEHAERYEARGQRVELEHPTARQIAAYQRYEKQVETLRGKFRAWAANGMLSKWYGFDLSELSIYHHQDNDTFTASWRDHRVGLLIVDMHQKDQPPDERHVFNVAVEAALQRKGIARKLYDAADAWLAKRGQHLVPSKVQHADGSAFWRDGSRPRLAQTRSA